VNLTILIDLITVFVDFMKFSDSLVNLVKYVIVRRNLNEICDCFQEFEPN
jgi:hypothetical protein